MNENAKENIYKSSIWNSALIMLIKNKWNDLINFIKLQPKEFVLELLTFFFICLWIYVGSIKILNYKDFKQAMIDQPFEDKEGIILSYLLPILQLGTAMLFIFDKTRKYGFWLTIILMTVFSIYITLVLKRTWEFIPCGCTLEFSVGWKGHLWINGIIILICSIALFLEKTIRDCAFKRE